MAKRTYVATLEPSEEGYGVSFPDVPGCVSSGVDLPDAIRMAEEALSLHLEGLTEDGEPIPDAVFTGGTAEDFPDPRVIWTAITVELPDAAERVNVYLPKSLLERVDRFSDAAGINRSAFFGQAARLYLGEGGPRAILDRHQAMALRAALGGGPSLPEAQTLQLREALGLNPLLSEPQALALRQAMGLASGKI